MLSMISVFSSAEHTIIKGSGVPEAVERAVEGIPQREGCLFVVHYHKLGVFCICEWVGGGKDTFVDVMNLGKSLGNFGREESLELRKRLFAPVTAEDTSKAIIGADSDFYHGLQDEDSEETERQERVAIGE